MFKNSNQQSHQVSIRAKRQQLHTDIRRRQIQEYFAAKRHELFLQQEREAELLHFYKSLDEKIQQSKLKRQFSQDLENQIFEALTKFPNQKWNLGIIGNYIECHPSRIREFENYIFDKKNLQNQENRQFIWSISIYIKSLYDGVGTSCVHKDRIIDFDKIDDFVSLWINKFWRTDQINQLTMFQIEIILICFEMMLNFCPNQIFFPIQSFRAILSRLESYYQKLAAQKFFEVRSLKIRISDFIIFSIQKIKSLDLYSQQERRLLSGPEQKYIISSSLLQKFIVCSSNIFYDNMSQASQNRIKCIECTKFLCYVNPIASGQFIFTRKNIDQFIFLMANHNRNISILILKMFNQIFYIISNKKLFQFLNSFLHINLVSMLKKALDEVHDKSSQFKNESELLLSVMILTNKLLNRVADIDKKTIESVLNSMMLCEDKFDDLLEYMGTKRYTDEIEEIFSEIVDNYFSQDDCCHEQANQQNNQHLMNHNHYHQHGLIDQNKYQHNGPNDIFLNHSNFNNNISNNFYLEDTQI